MWFIHPCYLPPTVCYLGTYSHTPTCSLAPCAVHPLTIHPSVYLPSHPFTCLLTTPSPPPSLPSTNTSVHLLIYPPSHPSSTIHPSPCTLMTSLLFPLQPVTCVLHHFPHPFIYPPHTHPPIHTCLVGTYSAPGIVLQITGVNEKLPSMSPVGQSSQLALGPPLLPRTPASTPAHPCQVLLTPIGAETLP